MRSFCKNCHKLKILHNSNNEEGNQLPITRLTIKNFKSIKHCDIALIELNVFIGENGTGKTNLLDAISYFYRNLTSSNPSTEVFDENNHYSNEVRIALTYDLSEFVKISKSNTDEVPDFSQEEPIQQNRYSGYYRQIISIASKAKSNKICVELTQIKGRPIQWNCTYEERLIFKSLFPVFYINTRSLDVTEWGRIWSILGDLAKVSNSERKIITEKINAILLDRTHETSKKLQVITEIFEKANVSVKPAMAKDFATILAKTYFSGDNIQQQGKHLNYYSTGTNSVKYIELLLKSIDALSRIKMKEPIVLFDEPEISLHTSFLDELAEAIIEANSKLTILVSTHSSRLTKNLITSSDRIYLYNAKLINKYSSIQQMQKFPLYSPTSKYRVVDDHINAYFSKANLFVEGETELELFSNPYLRILFPELKRVDVFKGVSDKLILNIMNPKLSHSKVPYICLIDIDKAVSYNKSKKRFELKREFFPANQKEQLLYRNKHESDTYLYLQRKRINAMQNNLHVHYSLPFLSCNDPNYYAFVSAVQQYLLSYNVFCLTSTIEGTLINDRTMNFALNFLENCVKSTDFQAFILYWESLYKNDKVNCLRILFNGKSDLLRSRKDLFNSVNSQQKRILEKITIGPKTSGWVSNYLDAFFREATTLGDAFSEKNFRRYLDNDVSKKKILTLFSNKFAELYSLIDKLCAIIQNEVA